MEINTIVVGPLETNCYILTIDNECIIIDPGDDFDKIKKTIENKNVVGVLLTHFHPDHIGALEEVISLYDLKINEVNSKKFEFETIATPGHTNESVCYYFKKNNTMFTGDFIFKQSIGRTDLGGSDTDMKNSLDMISNYPDNIIIYPGHGPKTILGNEKKYFRYYF